ncbi:MAG TPA: hypothetical protein VJ821_11805, partial [Anaerolineales bacterium]|nr:hypothetical protein [Anaerolineales bacterium]
RWTKPGGEKIVRLECFFDVLCRYKVTNANLLEAAASFTGAPHSVPRAPTATSVISMTGFPPSSTHRPQVPPSGLASSCTTVPSIRSVG